jgi:hypothetical protein
MHYWGIDKLRKHWGDSKPIVFKGRKYRVGKMSYGQYFLEPYDPRYPQGRGERESFPRGTLWLEEGTKKNQYGIDQPVLTLPESEFEKLSTIDQKLEAQPESKSMGYRFAGSLFDTTQSRKAESKTFAVINFPQENRVATPQKDLYVAGTFKNFFQEGSKHVEIFNVHGEKVRDLKLEGDDVLIWAGEGEPVLRIPTNTDILYEPWLMDVGSLVFHSPPNVKEFPVGEILKIATENDTVRFAKQ